MCRDAHGFPIHQKTPSLHRLDKFFTLEFPHSLEQPEGFPGMPQPKQGMPGLVVANNINNTNNVNFPSMPMCGGMHMDFLYIRNPQACTDWKGIYFAVGEPAPSQPRTVRTA